MTATIAPGVRKLQRRIDVGAEVEDGGEGGQQPEDENRPLECPPEPAEDVLRIERAAEPVAQLRPENQEPEGEPEGEEQAGEHPERGEPLAGEAPRLLAVVDAVEPTHQCVHRARRRPEGEQEADDDQDDPAALVLDSAVQAVADERDRLLRTMPSSRFSIDSIVSGSATWCEDADGDEEHRGDRKEGVVGESGGDVGDGIRLRLLGAVDEQREHSAHARSHQEGNLPESYRFSSAGVAELADATGLGPVGRKPLEVRVLSPA